MKKNSLGEHDALNIFLTIPPSFVTLKKFKFGRAVSVGG